MFKRMIRRFGNAAAAYWLPVSAALVGQGLAIRAAAEARGYVAVGGEALFLPTMYMVYRIARTLSGAIGGEADDNV